MLCGPMVSILMYADTVRSPELRHEVPHSVMDPFLYLEQDGRRFAVLRSLEVARMSEVPGMTPIAFEELGLDDLLADGRTRAEAALEIAARACGRLGVTEAVVPPAFPTELSDHLRANGVDLRVDRELFAARRRRKTDVQLAGIRRAQRAAEAAVAAVAELLRAASIDGEAVVLDGEPLTCERLKQVARVAIVEAGASADDLILAHGAQTCIGHHMGSGPIAVGEPITFDLWPRDEATGCYTDMTRTFVVGEPGDELRRYHALAKESLDRSLAAIRPGLAARELHRISCEPFERAGEPTQLTKRPGEVLLEGFFHGLGHGVGLEVHEEPELGAADGVLVAGDVIAVEPGCYRQGFGGVRLEDLVLVTDDGAEVITRYPYDLAP
jgi:Xaa-Pro aminopeptidase